MRVRRVASAALAAVCVALGSAVVASASDDAPAPAAAAAPARTPGVAPPLERPFSVADGVVRRTLAFGPGGLEQTLDVYGPAGGSGPRPTVLLVHGGGWRIGDSTEWADQAVELVREQGWTAVSLNYRLAPRHRWPAAYEDAAAALRLLHARADELGVDRDRIGALGDSAGGQLAALLGEPAADRPTLRAVVTWSGVNDLAGLTRQRSSGGCVTTGPCVPSGVARRVLDELIGCAPTACPDAYRSASPAAHVTSGHAQTLALSSEGEQIDPRQAWVMDAALHRAGVPSRVQVLAGDRHARGFQPTGWPTSMRFLAAALTPETAPAFPAPATTVTLDVPPGRPAEVGREVRLRGVVRPRQLGSTVALQVRSADGTWRTVRLAPLARGPHDTSYSLAWTPTRPGPVTWRAVWRGGGAEHTTTPRTVLVQ